MGDSKGGSFMRDIRTDLQDRAHSVAQQISAENARFESLVSQLRAEQDNKLEHLRALLHLANRLLDFTVWHEKVRAELTARIAVAEAAENLIKKSVGPAAELVAHS
jgi:hypothetical protein